MHATAGITKGINMQILTWVKNLGKYLDYPHLFLHQLKNHQSLHYHRWTSKKYSQLDKILILQFSQFCTLSKKDSNWELQNTNKLLHVFVQVT